MKLADQLNTLPTYVRKQFSRREFAFSSRFTSYSSGYGLREGRYKPISLS
ncbi:unnamed protein product [Ectocarpus sp. CCAP 1310/34]|nr:unnamed protein product [Ectocarpus sp. CCAP 1310/34]